MSPYRRSPESPAELPPDFRAARDAVVELVQYLDQLIAGLRGKSSDPAMKLPSGKARIPAARRDLSRLITSTNYKLNYVRDLLFEVRTEHLSVAEEVIEFANRFCVGMDNVTGRGSEDSIEIWLAQSALAVSCFGKGIVPASHFAYRAEIGLDFEFRKAEVLRSRRQPHQDRIWCDPSDRSIYLDGKCIYSNLSEDIYDYFHILISVYPSRITYSNMREMSPRLGARQQRVKERIPYQLLRLAKTTTRGHVLVLPMKK